MEHQDAEGLRRMLGPDVVDQINQFDNNRRGFYDWLTVQTITLPDLDAISDVVRRGMQVTAESFAISSLSIFDALDTSADAERLITQHWVSDDFERVVLFSQIMPVVEFFPINRLDIAEELRSALAISPNLAVKAHTLGEMYYETLWADVQTFLTGLLYQRQMKSKHRSEALFDYEQKVTCHVEPSASYFAALSQHYGNWALRQCLKGAS